MKRLLILLILLFALPAYAEQCTEETPCPELARLSPAMMGSAPVAAPAGAAFSDDFERGDSASLGASWTEYAGLAIHDGAVDPVLGSWAYETAKHNTVCSGVNQYAKFTWESDQGEGGILFRVADGLTECYLVTVSSGSWYWYRLATPTSDSTQIQTGSITTTSGSIFGITLTGTGASTVVRIWLNPTGLPSSATNWNGDDTPTVTSSELPGANNVDTGNYIGIYHSYGSSPGEIDNFFGGDIP